MDEDEEEIKVVCQEASTLTADDNRVKPKSGLGPGPIAGFTIGGVGIIVIAIIIILLGYCVHRDTKRKKEEAAGQDPTLHRGSVMSELDSKPLYEAHAPR